MLDLAVEHGLVKKSGAFYSYEETRLGQGRERAKGRGVRMGRKHKLTAHQRDEVRKRKAEGQSVRELGRSYNVSPNTISRVR